MNLLRGLAALVVGVTCVSAVPAQPIFGPPPGPGFGARGRIGIAYTGRNVRFAASYSSYNYGYGYGGYDPFLFGGPYYRQVTVVYSPPPQVFIQPIVINDIMRPPPEEPEKIVFIPKKDRPNGMPPPDPLERPLPGAPASTFRPIKPEDRARVAPPNEDAPPGKPPGKPPPPPDREPQFLNPPQPLADPEAEWARQIDMGRAFCAAGEYGRAEARFRQATVVKADKALAHFFLAQARFATGNYREAVEAIHAGMKLRRDWPTARFNPEELYGERHAEFLPHIKRLEDALGRSPKEPKLLFLLAYQLWFDGRQDEARILFNRALGLVADRRFVEQFLEVKPGLGPIVAK